MSLDTQKTSAAVDAYWENDALPTLSEYITVPCISPDYDHEWSEHGAIGKAARLFADWALARPIAGIAVEIVELPGRTPCVLIDVPSTGAADAPLTLAYGHLDKQPPLGEWSTGLAAFTPVRRDDRLFGRGAADDGYAMFAALGAIEVLQAQGVAHGPLTVLVEASEESASSDLDAYLDALAARLGDPRLVICLDSGGASYDRLWTTASLRGLVDGVLTVEVLESAIHSGLGGGIVPSSFRVLRQLLDRIDDPTTGDVLLPAARVVVPDDKRATIEAADEFDPAAALPAVAGLRFEGIDARRRAERGTWRATLEVLGAEGLPPIESAGNLLRPVTTVKVSVRIPPTADPEAVAAELRQALTDDPPEGARVSFRPGHAAGGWNAPPLEGWLSEALATASRQYFGKPAMAYGVGGTIPFMGALAIRYPKAQFVATGVLGPDSNAHGIDENLHVPTAKSLTACIAQVLAA